MSLRAIRYATCSAFLIGVVAAPPPAALAAWGGWQDLGGVILEAPNCVNWGANRIDCFARGTDRAMYHRWWDGSAWGGWEDLGGTILEAPNCVSWSVNRIDCFARGTDQAMYHRWWDGNAWGGWESLGGIILEGPNCVSWGEDRIDCFGRGTDRAMYHRWWDGTAWGGWEDLGGVLLEAPNCVTWGVNRIDCFARGTNAAMWHRWWDGSHWGGWEDLGGVLLEAPNCVTWGVNRIDCFARGTDQAMYHRWWDGNAWGGWENLGGVIREAPNCVTWGVNRIDCFARGLDSAMWHRWWDGSHWDGWENLGGVLLEGQDCVSWGGNRIDCFGRGTNAALWHKWWDCPNCDSMLAVWTYHYDVRRTGWNQHEQVLTTANVKAPEFGLLHPVTLDDQVDAQPLLVAGQTVQGQGTHNVVYVATEANTVYAIDATSGTVLKHQNFGPPVPKSIPGSLDNCNNNAANIGIGSTPVIDQSAGVLYAITYTLESGKPVYRLHAIDLSSLTDKVPSVVVSASHKLSNGSIYNFQPEHARQRAGLLAANGNIYAGFASWCDFHADVSRGWLLGWEAGSLKPLAANHLNDLLQPDPVPPSNPPFNKPFFLSSIWMAGYGIAADEQGNLFFATGNSHSSATAGYGPPNNVQESIVKLPADLTKIDDFFTPADVVSLDQADNDTGSGGIMLLPYQPGPKSRIAVAAGKVGQMFLLDRQNLGGFTSGGPNKVLGTFNIGGCWCGESYYFGSDGAGHVVSSGGNQVITWKVQITPTPTLAKQHTSPALSSGQDPGFMTSVSSNGTAAGTTIVWAVGKPIDSSPANVTLYAIDASNGTVLFSDKAGTWPNVNGGANIVPVVANGKVYVASFKQLAIFGLGPAITLPPVPPAERVAVEAPTGPEVTGTISSVDGSMVVVRTRSGENKQVDASRALEAGTAPPLVVGKPFTATGTVDPSGVLHADTIMRAVSNPAQWPADR